MNANELMIGDIVLYNDIEYKVDALYGSNVFVGLFPYNVKKDDKYLCPVNAFINDVFPLRLTKEILEKNGFENYVDFSCNDYLPFNIYMCKEEDNKDFIEGQEGDITYYCCYVHTLQHVLRDFDLDDSADNFKI